MGRFHLRVAMLSLLCAACVDNEAPETSRRGRYVLARINGDPLPVLFVETGAARLYFRSGELRLNNDETFTDITHMRRESKGDFASTSFPSDTTKGTYAMSGNTVVFTTTLKETYRMTFQSSGSLVQELAGNLLTYRK